MRVDEQYKKILGSLSPVEPPKGLEGRILTYIETRAEKAKKLRFAVFFGIFAVSLAALGAAFEYFSTGIQQSGFGEYLALPFKDPAVLSYWRELIFSLTESLPVIGLAAVFAAAAFLVWSLANVVRNASVFKFGFN